jgi:hypothetical protein
MTITQAHNINAVCSFFLGPLNEYERPVPEAEAMEALAELAAQANKALYLREFKADHRVRTDAKGRLTRRIQKRLNYTGWTESRVKLRFPCRPQPIRRKGAAR